MSRRPYLDEPEAGGRQSPYTTLERLSRCLEALDERQDLVRDDASRDDGSGSKASRLREEPVERQRPFAQRGTDDIRPHLAGHASDAVQPAGRIANELMELRAELRRRIGAAVRDEFQVLRGSIERARAERAGSGGPDFAREVERISGEFRSLAERSEEAGIVMDEEIEEIGGLLDGLAREAAAPPPEQRPEAPGRRIGEAGEGGRFRRLAALADRLEQIGSAVDSLPEALSLGTLEEKLRSLATAVEHLVSRPPAFGFETFTQIELRLDEISRAIVASTIAAQSPHVDPEPFQRIEARVAALARQIEEVVRERPSAELVERLGALSERVDRMAERMQLPERALERLSDQLAAIAGRIDLAPRLPEAETMLSGIEHRFDLLSEALERRHDEMAQGSVFVREVGRRLDEIAGRLGGTPEADVAGLLAGIEERIGQLAGALEKRRSEALEQGNFLLRELERGLDGVADRLEAHQSRVGEVLESSMDARLAALARQLEETLRGNATAGLEGRLDHMSQRLDDVADRVVGLNSDLVGSLAAQDAALSAHLARAVAPFAIAEEIGPRLDAIEKRIAESREGVLEAVGQAASHAARSLVGNYPDADAVAVLTDEFKGLETLARRSDDRNSRTFEAIHDTLLKIVDRLESRAAGPDRGGPAVGVAALGIEAEAMTPAPADGEAASLPLVEPEEPDGEAAAGPMESLEAPLAPASGRRRSVRSMLGGLFSGRKGHVAQTPPEAEAESGEDIVPAAPAVSLDAPLDPGLANRPLEPGSRAPDLNAIMRRVRDERSQAARVGEADAAKSDFIAAARRAARAAAAEAEALKRKSDLTGPVKALRIGDLLKSRRKPLLMAGTGIALALAGMQLGKAFVSDPVQTAERQASPALAAADGSPLSAAPQESAAGREAEIAARDAEAAIEAAGRADAASSGPAPLPAGSGAAIEVTVGPAELRRAAASGDPVALYEAASRLAEGRGTRENLPEAARLYEKAAELGLAPAQFRVGNLYEKGIGVARDIAASKLWYERAAEQGHAGAMHNLAVLLAMGADGAADSERAASWFVSAAALGVQDSQFNLGVLAAKGIGMPRNLGESYKWFALAAKSGDEDAAGKRDEVAGALSPEQLAEARAAVERWKPAPLDPSANAVDLPKEWLDGGAAATEAGGPIRDVQLILNEKGFDAGSPDGVMGTRTREAIARFQADNGMEPTGEVDDTLVGVLLPGK